MLRRQLILGALCFVVASLVGSRHGQAQWTWSYPPTAVDDYAFTISTDDVSVDVTFNDSAGSTPVDPTTVEIVSGPAFGDASVDAAGNIVYVPPAGSSGQVQIEYVVSSEEGLESNVAVLDIDVIHFPPSAADDADMTSYIWWAETHVLDNDSPGTASIDPSSIEIVTDPSNGTLTVDTETGVISYHPTSATPGSDTYQYRVSDEYGAESNVATVTIDVMNAPPSITSFTVTKSSFLPYTYTFSGHVDDEEPWLCSVRFGGLLEGHPDVTPGVAGDFSFIIDFGEPVGGSSTAIAQDSAGQDSETATATILY